MSHSPEPDDAERIVACLNFCREFSTKWLQGHKLRFIKQGDEIRSAADIPNFDGLVACQLIPVAKENA